MERLTTKSILGGWTLRVPRQEAVDRLAAYENTELCPEEVEAQSIALAQCKPYIDAICDEHGKMLINPIRLAELAQAEKDRRLVVLPCKVGDAVWRVVDDCTIPGYCGTKQKCKGCGYRNLFIEKWAFRLSLAGQNGKLNPPYYMTREEAEAALKKMEEADNEAD